MDETGGERGKMTGKRVFPERMYFSLVPQGTVECQKFPRAVTSQARDLSDLRL